MNSDKQSCSIDVWSAAAVSANVRSALFAADIWQVESSRTHLLSPEPFRLSQAQLDTLQRLGDALLSFYEAANKLYLHKGNEWVDKYLDIGKGEELTRHAKMNYQRNTLPRVLRPDVLITNTGFSITELDSVPGGFGHLDCLSRAYSECGFDLIGGGTGITEGFSAALREAAGKDDLSAAIVVSDESDDYRAEMTYLASSLRDNGITAFCRHPREVGFTEDGMFLDLPDGRLKIDVLYRFFELFDLPNIPKSELFAYASKRRAVTVTPPYKHFLEEKMLMALLHMSRLEEYWRVAMGNGCYELLMSLIVPTWTMDNRPVPPHAEVSDFAWRGNAIREWQEIAEGTQKERRLVIKPSGFSTLAWGSRGVKVGSDMSQPDWASAVSEACDSFASSPWVVQPFADSALVEVPYHDVAVDDVRVMRGRVRLCPYYFVYEGKANLGGVLATVCPKDKKLIHGMADAVLVPCCVA